jgi:N-acetylglucosamine-6-phosphate deacetylase
VPPAALKVMLRAKGLARSILVTDATAAADAPPGTYGFAGMAIERSADGRVQAPGTDVLAGSALRLDDAVRNIAAWGLADEAEARAMASTRPLALLAPAFAAHGIPRPAGVG